MATPLPRISRNKILFFLILSILIGFYCFLKIRKPIAVPGHFISIIILSNIFTVFLFWAIVSLLKLLSGKSLLYTRRRRLDDFIIGDEGGYSLSRLQAVLWAVTIISYLISVQLSLLWRGDVNGQMLFFDPELSESALWLLALSLTSCITVKGITVEKIRQDPARMIKKTRRKPRPIDLVTGDNGLDFSKCQMLLWTIIAIVIFNQKVYEFTKNVYGVKAEILPAMFKNHYEDYAQKKPEEQKLVKDNRLPYLPYLPWTFIVLMGLSQGAYVGKKLVPNFKLPELQTRLSAELQIEASDLVLKKQLLEQLVASANTTPTVVELQNLEHLQLQIQLAETRITDLKKDLLDIETLDV